MAVLTAQKVSDGLTAINYVAANAGGDQVPGGVELGGWSLPVVLLVRNASAVSVTVTVGDLPGLAIAAGDDAAIQVNAGIHHGGLVDVDYSAAASVTVAALDLSG